MTGFPEHLDLVAKDHALLSVVHYLTGQRNFGSRFPCRRTYDNIDRITYRAMVYDDDMDQSKHHNNAIVSHYRLYLSGISQVPSSQRGQKRLLLPLLLLLRQLRRPSTRSITSPPTHTSTVVGIFEGQRRRPRRGTRWTALLQVVVAVVAMIIIMVAGGRFVSIFKYVPTHASSSRRRYASTRGANQGTGIRETADGILETPQRALDVCHPQPSQATRFPKGWMHKHCHSQRAGVIRFTSVPYPLHTHAKQFGVETPSRPPTSERSGHTAALLGVIGSPLWVWWAYLSM